MKRCPECHELFDDQKAFCDMDGSELTETNAASRAGSAWVTGAIGGLIGVIVCVLLYIAFLAPGQHDIQEQTRHAAETTSTPARSTQVATAPLNTQVPALESPSPAASPEEATPSPTQPPAAPVTTPPPATLNNGPIATGSKWVNNGERAIIKMKDGSSVEADAAWEDKQGVWFRRSGLVSFVEKSRVEAITEVPPRRPSPAETKSP